MAKTREDFIARIQMRLKFKSSVPGAEEADIISALEAAVDRYSKDKPREKLHVITGDGTNRYALPSDWESKFSTISYIEFPAGDNALNDPSLLDAVEYLVWEDASGEELQFRLRDINTGSVAWMKYTLRHTLDATTNTVPDSAFEAVSFLGTGYAALDIAAQSIRNRGSSEAGGQIINFRTSSDMYKSFASEMIKMYYQRIGASADEAQIGVIEIFDMATLARTTNVPWLTHQNR